MVTPTDASARTLERDVRTFLDARGVEDRPVRVVPPWTGPPDGRLSPDAIPTFERLGTLALAASRAPMVAIAPVRALFQRVLDPGRFRELSIDLEVDDEIEWEGLLETLVEGGYLRVDRVDTRGEIAVRGGVIDVFPPDRTDPLRVELDGERIESIRPFDPATQRSRGSVESARVGPCREVLLSPRSIEEAAVRIKTRADALGVPKLVRDGILDPLRAGLRAPGLEAYLPAFHPDRVPVATYVGDDAPLVLDRPIEIGRVWGGFLGELEQWEELVAGHGRLFFPSEDFWDTRASVSALPAVGRAVRFDPLDEPGRETIHATWGAGEAPVPRDLPGSAGFEPVANRFRTWLDRDVSPVVAASSEGQAVRIEELLRGRGLETARAGTEVLPRLQPTASAPHPVVRVTVAAVSDGWRWPELGIVLVADHEIFGRKKRRSPPRRARGPALDLSALEPGDRIVHREFGIGVFRGLETLSPGGTKGDYLKLEYANDDRLYLPVDRIELVQKYVGAGTGDGSGPALSKLGGTGWARIKERVRARVLEMATELANLFAARKLAKGFAFPAPDSHYLEFAASFPFEETPDQDQAIEDVLGDMTRPKVMDRLVCGDVGYGKTEVAMRAAFLAVASGKQVAVLVPTTVLAAQHAQSFAERFGEQAVEIGSLSRLVTPARARKTLAGLRDGTIDIVIGTHRLLGADVRFNDLGLIIIDEEHRFGVGHKEKLRKLRTRVDVISMTATPIPRTLHLSLSGIRDLSLISTPPEDRQSIRTFITRSDDGLIRDAIRRELGRGGQVFFVHNRVQSIDRTAERIRELVPEATVAVAHGQMAALELETTMLGFVRGETHVLVTSAIIESGLDIPKANTILIDRADTFGLAQLYQIRGRVGRGPVQAHAFLLVPDETLLTGDAVRRLEALRSLSDLGSGFRLAVEDLEIRGAGNLLGRDQSGHVTAVGFDLYESMVEEAMAELDGRDVELEIEPEIHFRLEAFVPEAYVPDTRERLLAYRQLARARTDEELEAIRYEWIDRFGRTPPEVENLVRLMALKCDLRRTGAVLARRDKASVTLQFHERAPIDPARLVEVAAGRAARDEVGQAIRVLPDGKVRLETGPVEWDEALSATRGLLRELETGTAPASGARTILRRAAP